MKKAAVLLLILLLMIALIACVPGSAPGDPPYTGESGQTTASVPETTHPEPSEPEPTVSVPPQTEPIVPETTCPVPTEPVPTEPEHSLLYLPGVSVDDVILYFNEVCLDSEFYSTGNPTLVQKWVAPIYYTLEGPYTESDVAAINALADWLNSVEGFPGLYRTEDPAQRNLRICFCDRQGMTELMGDTYVNLDGAVTFWYSNNEIYDAIICCLADLDEQLRTSVILEELYNGLGPVQDTLLRPDSIIYQEYAQPQWLTPVDELLIRLLYHPDILPGMDAGQCEQIIRELYY